MVWLMKGEDKLPKSEIEERRDRALKRMLKSPPKPHKAILKKRPSPPPKDRD